MASNNDYFNDIAGLERGSGKTNNQLLEIAASNGSTAGLTTEERERLNSLGSKADLVGGVVPESQLPSYIDAVQEYDTRSEFPATGLSNVIYVDNANNTAFRWGGTDYVQLSSGLVIGETSSSAQRGDYGKVAYEHTTLVNNPHGVTKGQIGLGNVNNTSDADKPLSSPQFAALATKENVITASGGNTYFAGDKSWKTLNKAAVGLSNVDNTADADKPITQAMLNAFGVKADLLNGKVPTSQLPSYVDAVQEYANLAAFPGTGMSNVVYLADDTNKPYRWGGSSYVEISSAGVALGETSSTAYRGDRGKLSFDHTSRTDNPHIVTKTQVGLSNVDNTSDLAKPVSTATAASIATKQNTLVSGTNIKTVNGTSIVGSGNVVVAGGAELPINTTTANNVTTKEFTNRYEYTCMVSFNRQVGVTINRYVTITTAAILPVGVTISGSDEHYISIRNQERDIYVQVWDNPTSRAIMIGLGNTWDQAATAIGTVFVKLVKFK